MNLKPRIITSKDPKIVDEHMSRLCEKIYMGYIYEIICVFVYLRINI